MTLRLALHTLGDDVANALLTRKGFTDLARATHCDACCGAIEVNTPICLSTHTSNVATDIIKRIGSFYDYFSR